MALGTLGSTLNDELNRLANGGTYRDMNQMVDEALAAKQWANRENINPYSTDTVGILNEIAGLGLDKKNWLDFNGVCNYIAGTTGLPAAAALRQVYPTTDLLTGVASYYVDATATDTYIPTTASGFMYLPGVSANFASSPDAAALDITGDIDVRCKVALDSWFSASTQVLVSKFNATGNQRSYALRVVSSGLLNFTWSTNGSGGGANPIVSSTAALTVIDGQALWVRATLDVDNGASGNTVTFFTSTDGTNWTQLGDAVVTAGTTSIFNSTATVNVGSRDGGITELAKGKFYRAQVLNGIGGTVAFDANFETAMTSQTVTSFTESSSNAATVTINRTTYNFQLDTIANLGTAGSLLPTTLGSSTAADSNDPKFLDFTGTNYVYLPGVASNLIALDSFDALNITGDIDLRAYVALDDWTPAATNVLISKFDNNTVAERAYELQVSTTGALVFVFAVQGGSDSVGATSTVVPTIADGQPLWVRATLDVDNGAGGYDVKFFTSTDGTTWTQLGATVTGAGTVTIRNSGTEFFALGRRSTGSFGIAAGKFFRAQVFNGIDGTKVLDVDTSVITAGSATSFTAVTGQTVTINRSTSGRKTVAVTQPTWLFGTDDYMEVNNRYMSSGTYLYLPGVASNYASAPDAAPLDITGDIDLRVKVAMDDWTPSATQVLVAKYASGTQYSYALSVASNGRLQLGWSPLGTTASGITVSSTVAPTISDGSTLWVRGVLDVNNGASGNDVYFYTSTDGTTWTQLGTTVTTAGTTSIFNSTSVLEIGSLLVGTSNPLRGKVFRAQVLNGINGTVAFDANFETSITSLNQASFTESSANAATVTINRSGSAYRSAGITTAGYLYPGATNTFSASATDFLNFGASDSFTMLAVARRWNTQAYQIVFYKKFNDNNNSAGYGIFTDVSDRAGIAMSDGVNGQALFSGSSYPSGALTSIFAEREVATDRLILTTRNTITGTDITTGSLSSLFSTLTVGRQSSGNYADMEFFAGAVFRSALSNAQIRQISNYFANREVYL